jgi:hypothetical protein
MHSFFQQTFIECLVFENVTEDIGNLLSILASEEIFE